jgi:hypothetical protein
MMVLESYDHKFGQRIRVVQTFFMMLKLHNNINIVNTFIFMDVYQKIQFALGKSIMVALNC